MNEMKMIDFLHSAPEIVCLCGSTRFTDAFRAANLNLTLSGAIVLSVGCDTKSDDALSLTERDKDRLDELHLRKIDLADRVHVLNVDGYIGESTRREIAYAMFRDKAISFLDERRGNQYLEDRAHELGKLLALFAMGATLPVL